MSIKIQPLSRSFHEERYFKPWEPSESPNLDTLIQNTNRDKKATQLANRFIKSLFEVGGCSVDILRYAMSGGGKFLNLFIDKVSEKHPEEGRELRKKVLPDDYQG